MRPFSRVVESVAEIDGHLYAVVRGVRLVELAQVGECEVSNSWECVRAPLSLFDGDAKRVMAAARAAFRETFLSDDETARERRAVLEADAQRRGS